MIKVPWQSVGPRTAGDQHAAQLREHGDLGDGPGALRLPGADEPPDHALPDEPARGGALRQGCATWATTTRTTRSSTATAARARAATPATAVPASAAASESAAYSAARPTSTASAPAPPHRPAATSAPTTRSRTTPRCSCPRTILGTSTSAVSRSTRYFAQQHLADTRQHHRRRNGMLTIVGTQDGTTVTVKSTRRPWRAARWRRWPRATRTTSALNSYDVLQLASTTRATHLGEHRRSSAPTTRSTTAIRRAVPPVHQHLPGGQRPDRHGGDLRQADRRLRRLPVHAAAATTGSRAITSRSRSSPSTPGARTSYRCAARPTG